MAPEHERVFGAQRPIRHSKRAEFSFVRLWPNDLRVMIRHALFNLFAKRCVRTHTIIVRAYFLESSDLYK